MNDRVDRRMLRRSLQLGAVVALVGLVFGLPRLHHESPAIPDPTPHPLLASSRVQPPPAEERVEKPSRGAVRRHQPGPVKSRSNKPKRERRLRHRAASEPHPRGRSESRAAAPVESGSALPTTTSSGPATEFGWP